MMVIITKSLYNGGFSVILVLGRGDRTRTYNQRFWRPLLYQLSYTPIEPLYYNKSLSRVLHFFDWFVFFNTYGAVKLAVGYLVGIARHRR